MPLRQTSDNSSCLCISVACDNRFIVKPHIDRDAIEEASMSAQQFNIVIKLVRVTN